MGKDLEKNSTCIIESLCCTPEPLTTLSSTIFQHRIKIYFFKVHTVKSSPPTTQILLSYRGNGNYQFGAYSSTNVSGACKPLYCAGQKVCLDFSFTSDGESQMNFLVSPMCCLPPLPFYVFYYRKFKQALRSYRRAPPYATMHFLFC